MASLLYISYTGLLQPLGQSQVFAYLRPLAQQHEIVLLSYERAQDMRDTERMRLMRDACSEAGLVWCPLRYHKTPAGIATAWDIVAGLWTCLWLHRRHGFQLIHCRSYVPSVIGLTLARLYSLPWVFDMRGLWPDERVEGGIWKSGSLMHRIAKGFERRFLCSARVVVSLTQSGVDVVREFPALQDHDVDFRVIPTCTNLAHFIPLPAARESRDSAAPVMGYLGSAGSWYLFDDVLRTYRILLRRNPTARLLIYNRSEHEFIRQRLLELAIPEAGVDIASVEFDAVPRALSEVDFGVFFCKPFGSKRASAPTRFGEYLGCGKPCITNAGIGDMERILASDDVGYCISSFDDQTLEQALQHVLALCDEPDTAQRCRAVAEREFSLDKGVAAYAQLYQDALSGEMP